MTHHGQLVSTVHHNWYTVGLPNSKQVDVSPCYLHSAPPCKGQAWHRQSFLSPGSCLLFKLGRQLPVMGSKQKDTDPKEDVRWWWFSAHSALLAHGMAFKWPPPTLHCSMTSSQGSSWTLGWVTLFLPWTFPFPLYSSSTCLFLSIYIAAHEEILKLYTKKCRSDQLCCRSPQRQAQLVSPRATKFAELL